MGFKEIDNYINQNFFTLKKYDKEIVSKAILFINKIREALNTNSKLVIYGDYDCDGISSATLLEELIRDYAKSKKREANIEVIIPSREMGYGLSPEVFEELQKEDCYIFTLDNGTHKSFLETIEPKNQEKLFIIDHHPNGDCSNMKFVLNPNKDGKMVISTAYLLDYVYEVLIQVDKDFGKNADRFKYADLVAMSLVSDMADLNNIRVRHLIMKGFEKINRKERMLFRHLFPKKDSKITYNDIAFEINPRSNSSGRISSTPKDAVTILKYKEPSNRAKKSIEYLNSLNELRKNHLNNFINIALEEIKNRETKDKNIIFYYNKDIPLGLNGLVAQRIYEIYEIPALVASNSKTTDRIKGSGRGFNIKYILNMFRDNDIFTYGGHNEALGFEIKDLEVFNEIMKRANTKNIPMDKEFNNIILEDKFTISDYIAFSRELSVKSNTIPFKQKLFVQLENVDINIKKIFRNNFCYLEIKDKNSNEKISYFTKHNIAKEMTENKEKFYISMYSEFNPKKVVQDFSGDIILDKNLNRHDVSNHQDLFLYQ